MFKKLYIIFVVLLYSLCLSFILNLILFNIYNQVAIMIVTYSFIVLSDISVLYMIIMFILMIIQNEKINCSFNFIRNIKLSLIPFYLFFGIIGLLLSFGYIVPFLWVVVTIALVVGAVFGYVSVIITSLPNIMKVIKIIFFNKKYDIILILSLIFQFFFVLDVVGSITLSIYYKEDTNDITSDMVSNI